VIIFQNIFVNDRRLNVILWLSPESNGPMAGKNDEITYRRLRITGWSDFRESCLAISAYLSYDGRGPHHHVEAARRWCRRDKTERPPSGLSRIWASPARHLWHYFFHFWPLVLTLGRGPTVGSLWSFSTPPSLERGQTAPPPSDYLQRSPNVW